MNHDNNEVLEWILAILLCGFIALVLFWSGHWILGVLWCLACARKWIRDARGLSTSLALVWILSVQLMAGGPVYHFPVKDCSGFNTQVADLLAWADRSKVYGVAVKPAPEASCAWWDATPPEFADVRSPNIIARVDQ